jgi:hypothetical protein
MRNSPKLLALLTAFSVAPAMAVPRTPLIAPAGLHSKCPYERARAAAAWAAELRAIAPAPKAPTTITLTDRVPSDSSLFGGDGGASFLRP